MKEYDQQEEEYQSKFDENGSLKSEDEREYLKYYREELKEQFKNIEDYPFSKPIDEMTDRELLDEWQWHPADDE